MAATPRGIRKTAMREEFLTQPPYKYCTTSQIGVYMKLISHEKANQKKVVNAGEPKDIVVLGLFGVRSGSIRLGMPR